MSTPALFCISHTPTQAMPAEWKMVPGVTEKDWQTWSLHSDYDESMSTMIKVLAPNFFYLRTSTEPGKVTLVFNSGNTKYKLRATDGQIWTLEERPWTANKAGLQEFIQELLQDDYKITAPPRQLKLDVC
jgi:hypothetical protein